MAKSKDQYNDKYTIVQRLESSEWLDISKVEEMYNASFVGEFSIKDVNGNWIDQPVPIFYQTTPPQPEYSNYFGLLLKYDENMDSNVMITSGQSAVDKTWAGFISHDGQNVYYSRYRHDFVKDEYGDYIDGGPEYVRSNVVGDRLVQLTVKDGVINIDPLEE